ncbi:hypothetical protein BDQ17DRAFT_1395866 [Cyathus striatus]|nr:hypothetical protein BDQ17DRAFT_1395866 [Cyathus striatus]
MASPYAFVTLVSSDSYLPGALALAAALNDLHPSLAPKAFDIVIGVEILDQEDTSRLKLLRRPDLTTVLTKLHVFRLTQYSKIIFLDADVLPIRPISHLFQLPHEFAAAPDVGWPDIFNSGVLVLSPGDDKFAQLDQLIKSKGSWDGGDQGILNEWRGDNWHRLSFTFNTTPTAAYTYAPAYERFGSQISVIHFIGPNKPWKSIPYRSPFTTHIYDYDSLVDSVQHYSAAWDDGTSHATRTFPTRNTALGLDELKKLAIEGMNTSGLYRSMPLEGRVDLMRPKKEVPEEAEEKARTSDFDYDDVVTPVSRSLSLPDGSVYWKTMPTPGPHEIPSSPRLPIISLPPLQFLRLNIMRSLLRAIPTMAMVDISMGLRRLSPHQASVKTGGTPASNRDRQQSEHHQHQHSTHHVPHTHNHGHRPHHVHQEQPRHPTDSRQGSGQRYNSEGDGARTPQQEQQRSHSPPLLLWDPAKDPPPKTQPTPSAFPTDTYFQNVWDQTSSGKSRDSSTDQDGSKGPGSAAFFEPPPPSEIPDLLLREGHYRNVTGQDGAQSAPVPDPSKVKSIFPWEDKLRQLPGRVFPTTDAPKLSQFASPPVKPSPVVESPSSPPKPTSPIRLLSPLGLSTPLRSTYSNAWDSVPSIQKYASKLVRPPPAPTPMFPAFDEEWRKNRRKSWDERVEVSSRDGDDEDNADDEDEEEQQAPTHTNQWDNDDDSEIEAARRLSRRGSIASSYSYKGKRKEYRSRGVQTVQREKRHQSIQVSTDPPLRTEQRRGSSASSGKRQWTASGSLNISSFATMQTARAGHDISVSTAAPSPMSEVPQGHSIRTRATRVSSSSVSPTTSISLRSSREFVVSPVARVPQKSSPPSTRVTSPTVRTIAPQAKPTISTTNSRPPSLVMRQISNDSSLPSPASSAGPLSPPDGQPISPSTRRAGRVWDPARGVELFKRGSEEVLARFLKMGSWE